MSAPAYGEYRDTGVSWLGELPNHWQSGALCRIATRVVVGIAEAATHAYANAGTPILRATNIRASRIIGELLYVNEDYSGGRESKQLQGGDLVTVRTGNAGVTAIVPDELDGCQCFTMLITTLDSNSSAEFYCYWLNSLSAQSYFTLEGWGTAQVNISVPILKGLQVPMPPLDEQEAIASFLDSETSKIDALVAEQRRLIELLKEKRQAVISHAVTKGLNPDVPTKPSGIEWLGDVPEHWRISQVRYEFDVLDGLRVPVSVEERAERKGEFPYYGASGIIDWIDDYLFDEPLVLVCEDGWNLHLRSQPVARPVDGRIWVNNHAHILRPKIGNTEVLAAVLEITPFSLFVTGTRQPKLTINELKKVPIAIPTDASEYDELREFIGHSSQSFDSLETEAERAIELLQERRTALISAAVTGKIDVREFACQETA